jgi:myosin regulatory light chain 12
MASQQLNRRRQAKNKRAKRMTSNVFAMFQQEQIAEYKEAFNMIDQDKDQVISKQDLQRMFESLGKFPSDAELDEMLKESPGSSPINFTIFLTMFGQKMMGTDPEDVIANAFGCFDEDGSGNINEEYLRELLTTMGDRFTHDQVDDLFHDIPKKDGEFNYKEFTKILKNGLADKEEDEK